MKRRTFLRTTSLATGAVVAHNVSGYQSDKIKIGIVGVGWWGTEFLLSNALASGHFDIIGLCDVSELALSQAAEKVMAAGLPKPKLFKDYKALYDEPDLSAVLIATPTHWHALQFIDACQKGLDVWLEKPISYDIREAQAMRQAYQITGNVVMVDFPRLHAPFNTEIQDYILSGQAGEIKQVSFNIHNPGGWPKVLDVPDYFDYEKFCGPGPRLPYMGRPDAGRPAWRVQHGFSRGILADWGIHYLQNIRTVMGLKLPDKITAIGGIVSNDGRENPDHLNVSFDFDQLPVAWSHKGWGYTSPLPHTNIGVWYEGEKASIFAADTGWEVYPKEGEMITYGKPRLAYGQEEYMEMVQQIFLEMFSQFADAVRKKSTKNIKGTFDEGFASTAIVNYADISYRTELPVKIDPIEMTIEGNDAANQMLKREYRPPYRHPYDG